ncbi:hypothetical protein [Paracoccus aestuarii]|uniref:hypothetical protein n=1 Tax=Paracoccus aestuarii TaxID=453842 RepID=UPI0011C376D6|nr:hypothetical protein [Paracoccus aestuarii]WCR01048.1 hypothetical protein JHW48_16060 [Paracoccus aestuarii]
MMRICRLSFSCNPVSNATICLSNSPFRDASGRKSHDSAEVTIGGNIVVHTGGIYIAGHASQAGRRNQAWQYAHPVTTGNDVIYRAEVSILFGDVLDAGPVIPAGSNDCGKMFASIFSAATLPALSMSSKSKSRCGIADPIEEA